MKTTMRPEYKLENDEAAALIIFTDGRAVLIAGGANYISTEALIAKLEEKAKNLREMNEDIDL